MMVHRKISFRFFLILFLLALAEGRQLYNSREHTNYNINDAVVLENLLFESPVFGMNRLLKHGK